MAQHIAEYEAHSINLTDEWIFEVEGALFEKPQRFPSLNQAKSEISDRVQAHAKQRKAEIALALPVLTDAGAPFIIRGINSVSHRVLGTAERARLYPAVAWIATLLKERAQVRERLNQLDRQLRPVEINAQRGYGNLAAAHYEGAIKSLQNDYANALSIAEAGNVRAA